MNALLTTTRQNSPITDHVIMIIGNHTIHLWLAIVLERNSNQYALLLDTPSRINVFSLVLNRLLSLWDHVLLLVIVQKYIDLFVVLMDSHTIISVLWNVLVLCNSLMVNVLLFLMDVSIVLRCLCLLVVLMVLLTEIYVL